MSDVIRSIVLSLGEKEIELTPEEAKKLFEGLQEMFDRKVVVEERHVHHDYPWRWTWQTPTVTYPYITYCGGSDSTSSGINVSYQNGTLQLQA